MTDVYEFSEYDRSRLIYNYSTMTPAEIDQAKAKLAAQEEKEASQKAMKTGGKPASSGT
jgi:hypothetical protein